MNRNCATARGRADWGSDAWGRQETRHSPLNRLWRAGAGGRGGDREAEKDPPEEVMPEREHSDPYLGISQHLHSFNSKVR